MDDICKLCHKQAAKYTCPRCHVRYCCIECYRSREHEQCSEAFYRDCFMEGLKDFTSTKEDKYKVLEMLQRLDQDTPELDSDDDEEEEVDLEDRMAGLDLDTDTDEVWRRLTGSEKAEFKKMVEEGRLGNVIDLWQPWWQNKGRRKVEEVGAEGPPVDGPPKLYHAPEMSTITKVQPSPDIPFNIVNILYGYAYVARLHNGSHLDTPQETIKEVESISEALGARSFKDVPSALHACLHCLREEANSCFVSKDFSVAILTDVKDILQGHSQVAPQLSVMAALSDVHRVSKMARKLIDKAMKTLPTDSRRLVALRRDRQHLYGVQKKVEFLLSWCHRYGLQLSELVPLVDLEFCALSTEASQHQQAQKSLEDAWGGKRPPRMHRFIEEITDR